MRLVRQKFTDAFHDKIPISVNKVVAGKDVHFFNAYSHIGDVSEQLEFSLNDADAVKLCDINDEGLVRSVICQVKFIAAAVDVSYFKDGKNRVDRMREGLMSDGTQNCQNNNLGWYDRYAKGRLSHSDL